MKKRILSLLLAAAMMLTAAPLAAFADEGASETVIGGADGPTAIYVSEGDPASVQDQIMLIQETPAEDAAEGPAEDHQLTYLAFGDSIAAGVGLDGFNFTPAEIFYAPTSRTTPAPATSPMWPRCWAWTGITPSTSACPP